MTLENSRGKILFLSIFLFCLTIWVITVSKPSLFYYYDNSEMKPIEFGYGKNKQILCLSSFCIIMPLFFYLFLRLLYN